MIGELGECEWFLGEVPLVVSSITREQSQRVMNSSALVIGLRKPNLSPLLVPNFTTNTPIDLGTYFMGLA